MNVTRKAIFEAAGKKLRSDFEELSKTIPHRGVKGGQAADLVRKFLNDHLPKRFASGSGFIIDRRDNISKQTDVIVYDAMNCPVYRASDDAGIFPADNVAAVVEVKSIVDGEKFAEAAANIAATKALAKTPPPKVPFLVQSQTLGCLVAFESSVSLTKLEDHYKESIKAHGLGRHIDLILVHDRAVITLASKPRAMDHWATAFFEGFGGKAAEGAHVAISRLELRELSLDAFLRFLLAQLAFFRGIVDHPGFGFPDAQMRLTYLMSFTNEKNPRRREEMLKRYAEEVDREFSQNPPPADE